MKRRHSQAAWSISVWLCLGGLGLSADSNSLETTETDRVSPRSSLQVFVYAYAPVSSAHLKLAKEVATGIYTNLGVPVEWVECYLAEEGLNSNPECSRLTPTTLVVRILPRSQAERFKQPHFVFGFAQTVHSGGFGYYASVFYHRVEELSGSFTSSTPVVLGHVIAHEMGHLLLGHGSHSRTGLMTANWDRKELERVNQRTFIFNSQQAKEIRARFLERYSSAEASRRGQVAEKLPIGGAADGAGTGAGTTE
jgi:hypothetical protein